MPSFSASKSRLRVDCKRRRWSSSVSLARSVCSRMLTYAHVCSRKQIEAEGRLQEAQVELERLTGKVRMLLVKRMQLVKRLRLVRP
jgi:hypothetical protein